MKRFYSTVLVCVPSAKWPLLMAQHGTTGNPEGAALCITCKILMAFFQVTPLWYFIHVSITTPVVSALKNYYR
jgi:hypothetical protein